MKTTTRRKTSHKAATKPATRRKRPSIANAKPARKKSPRTPQAPPSAPLNAPFDVTAALLAVQEEQLPKGQRLRQAPSWSITNDEDIFFALRGESLVGFDSAACAILTASEAYEIGVLLIQRAAHLGDEAAIRASALFDPAYAPAVERLRASLEAGVPLVDDTREAADEDKGDDEELGGPADDDDEDDDEGRVYDEAPPPGYDGLL